MEAIMKQEIIKTDVLCVGGGIAGLMAAIRSAELGANVIVVDKANTLRSGAGATGNDHFRCYIPEFHGEDFEAIVDEVANCQEGWTRPKSFVRTWLKKSFDIVKLWDSWGIPMKHDGKWLFAGHAFPGGPFTTLKYTGQNQKLILTRQAKKRGVKIINRVMILDLLTDGKKIVGALGMDAREGKLFTFRAKSVFLSTGDCVRLYPSSTPGWMFNRADPPSSTGDGRAMAYRVGAELINMEMPKRWAGPKYFARCGKATWIGVFKDSQDKPVGPFLKKPDRRYGDVIADAYPTLFEDYAKSGRGPVYMDCRGITEKDHEFMMEGLKSEGNTGLVNHLHEENIDIRKDPVEFTTYEFTTRGGIYFNDRAETSLPGLYAAGDEYFGAISCAATFGWIGGENAARYAKKIKSTDKTAAESEIAKRIDLLRKITSRTDGASWKEVNIALQQIMQDYAGTVRTESLLKAGITHLKRLKKKAYETIYSRDQHELMRCIEVLNLIDIGQIVCEAILERKETRGKYSRQDYPFANPQLNNKVLVCKRVKDKMALAWREL
jgi:succinate dehydrogenase/fumarate reductase flavoprotein subunit